jgi:hypothetical protein
MNWWSYTVAPILCLHGVDWDLFYLHSLKFDPDSEPLQSWPRLDYLAVWRWSHLFKLNHLRSAGRKSLCLARISTDSNLALRKCWQTCAVKAVSTGGHAGKLVDFQSRCFHEWLRLGVLRLLTKNIKGGRLWRRNKRHEFWEVGDRNIPKADVVVIDNAPHIPLCAGRHTSKQVHSEGRDNFEASDEQEIALMPLWRNISCTRWFSREQKKNL